MSNLDYDISKSHTVNQIETAKKLLPALKQQFDDQADVADIDEAIEFYQKVFDSKQFLFCVELASGNTKTGAMRDAGYGACSPKYANGLLDAHRGGVNHCYQLLLKRRYLTDAVDKKWLTSKLIHVVETAQDQGEGKTMIAACAELAKMGGHYMPITVAVQEHVSVEYSFMNVASQPVLRELVADIAPQPKPIDVKPMSDAAIEFSQMALPQC